MVNKKLDVLIIDKDIITKNNYSIYLKDVSSIKVEVKSHNDIILKFRSYKSSANVYIANILKQIEEDKDELDKVIFRLMDLYPKIIKDNNRCLLYISRTKNYFENKLIISINFDKQEEFKHEYLLKENSALVIEEK